MNPFRRLFRFWQTARQAFSPLAREHALVLAAQEDDVGTMARLAQQGVSLNADRLRQDAYPTRCSEWVWTDIVPPLMFRFPRYRTVRRPSLGIYLPQGSTPLHAAVLCGHARATQWLLQHNAQTQLGDAHGDTPAHLAANRGHLTLLWHLLKANPTLATVVNTADRTPIDALGRDQQQAWTQTQQRENARVLSEQLAVTLAPMNLAPNQRERL